MANEEVGNLSVKVSMDSTGFQNGISSINRELKVVQSEFKAASAQLGGFGNSTDQLKLKSDSLTKQIELQKQKVEALDKAFQASAEKKGLDAKATQDLQIKLNGAKTALANMDTELNKTNQELIKANQLLSEGAVKQGLFAKASEKTGINLGSLKTAFGAVGVAAGAYLSSAVGSAGKAQASTERLTKLLENQGESAAKASKDVKEFTGAITKMSTFSGGEAREALQTLLEKGISVGEALKQEGLLADIAAGKNVALSEAANMLADAYNGKTKALVALGILTKEEVKQYGASENAALRMDIVQKRLNDRFSGSAQAQLGTYSGQMKRMENQMNSAKTAIGSALLPILADLAKSIASIVVPIADFVKKNPAFTAAVLSMVAVLGTLVGGMSIATTVMAFMAPIAGSLGISMGALCLPVLAVVAAIGVLVFAGYEIYKNWDLIKAKAAEVWGAIGNFFTVTIPAAINTALTWFKSLPEKIVSFFKELPGKLGNSLGLALGTIAKWGVDAVQWAITNVPKIISNIITFFAELPGKIWTWLVGAFNKLISWGTMLVSWAVTEVPGIVRKIVTFFAELPGNMLDIGINLVKGLWNGIASMVNWIYKQVKGFASGVVKGFKEAFGIQSPSRVMAEVGKNISLGLAEGISDGTDSVLTSIDGQITAMQLKLQGESARLVEIQKQQAKEQAEVERESLVQAINTADSTVQQLIKQGAAQDKLTEAKRKAVEARTKLDEFETKAQVDATKEQIDSLKSQQKAIQDYQGILNDAKKVITTYYADLKAARDDYDNKVAEAQAQEIAKERQVTDEYQKALNSRANALSGFAGLFDQVTRKDISGEQLLNNLKGQVTAFEDWQENIKALSAKGVDEGLVEELKQMGPKAGPEIAALNTLTGDQLTQYVALWKQKNQDARNEATSELAQQKIEMEQKLVEIRAAASQQLEQYRADWKTKNAEIRKNAMTELTTIESKFKEIDKASVTYGVSLMTGFIAGIQSKKNELQTALEEMAALVDSYMPHSPAKQGPLSKIMEWGPALVGSLANGITSSLPKLEGVMNGLANISTMNPIKGTGVTNSYSYGGNKINITVQDGEDLIRTLHRLGVSL